MLVPREVFMSWIEGLNTTVRESGQFWHVHVADEEGHLRLDRKRGFEPIPLDSYLLR